MVGGTRPALGAAETVIFNCCSTVPWLFEAMIPRFALHWDFQDLVELIGDGRVFWTDPTNWMNRVVALGPRYRYRYVGEGDGAPMEEFLRSNFR